MALQKSIEMRNLQADYWRIVGFNVSFTGKMCQIYLCGYEDAATRSDKKNILANNFTIKGSDFDKYVSITDGVVMTRLYEYLLDNTSEFRNALSV